MNKIHFSMAALLTAVAGIGLVAQRGFLGSRSRAKGQLWRRSSMHFSPRLEISPSASQDPTFKQLLHLISTTNTPKTQTPSLTPFAPPKYVLGTPIRQSLESKPFRVHSLGREMETEATTTPPRRKCTGNCKGCPLARNLGNRQIIHPKQLS
ncbi:hypothetical protein AAMO2058_001172600 [Amorphochlora amoebiformis]